MHDRLLLVRTIALGKPATEPIDNDRAAVAEWLVSRLTDGPVRILQSDRTVYLTLDEVVNRPGQISHWLNRSIVGNPNGPAALVLDFARNPYDSLREPLLKNIAEFVVDWVRQDADRVAVIWLPSLPPNGVSIFWPALHDTGLNRRIFVFDNEGTIWTPGGSLEADREIALEGASRLAALGRDHRARLRATVIKEMGHFAVGDDREPFCARYFYGN